MKRIINLYNFWLFYLIYTLNLALIEPKPFFLIAFQHSEWRGGELWKWLLSDWGDVRRYLCTHVVHVHGGLSDSVMRAQKSAMTPIGLSGIQLAIISAIILSQMFLNCNSCSNIICHLFLIEIWLVTMCKQFLCFQFPQNLLWPHTQTSSCWT